MKKRMWCSTVFIFSLMRCWLFWNCQVCQVLAFLLVLQQFHLHLQYPPHPTRSDIYIYICKKYTPTNEQHILDLGQGTYYQMFRMWWLTASSSSSKYSPSTTPSSSKWFGTCWPKLKHTQSAKLINVNGNKPNINQWIWEYDENCEFFEYGKYVKLCDLTYMCTGPSPSTNVNVTGAYGNSSSGWITRVSPTFNTAIGILILSFAPMVSTYSQQFPCAKRKRVEFIRKTKDVKSVFFWEGNGTHTHTLRSHWTEHWKY